jgi:hypothetical protein
MVSNSIDIKIRSPVTHLLIIMLTRFTSFLSSFGASFFSFPRYVGFKSFQGMYTKELSASAVSSDTVKSYS